MLEKNKFSVTIKIDDMLVRYSKHNPLKPAIDFFWGRINKIRYRYRVSELLHRQSNAGKNNIERKSVKTITLMNFIELTYPRLFQKTYWSDLHELSNNLAFSEFANGLVIPRFDETNQHMYKSQQSILKYLNQ